MYGKDGVDQGPVDGREVSRCGTPFRQEVRGLRLESLEIMRHLPKAAMVDGLEERAFLDRPNGLAQEMSSGETLLKMKEGQGFKSMFKIHCFVFSLLAQASARWRRGERQAEKVV